MLRLRRWYNQNKKSIWKITGIVVFLILIIQVLNYIAKNQNNNKLNYNLKNNSIAQNNYTDLSMSTDKSVLTSDEISNSNKNLNGLEVINNFFAYCNNQKVKEAYELLTDECKEEMYPSLKSFQRSYYNKVFSKGKVNASVENWIGDIYKIEIVQDLLSTGEYNKDKIRQDYITVKKTKEDIYKLNINGYVDKEEINKQDTFYNNIDVIAKNKNVYMEYEIYTFEIKNNNDNPILLDNLEEIDSMYIQDDNNIKYSAYTHEISSAELLIKPGEKRTLKIKYYNKYSSKKKINNIVFSKVIIDYNSYMKLENKSLFNNYGEFKLNI